MSGLNVFSRAIIRLAGWIAGPENAEWCAAMAAETDAAGRTGTAWAAGCLLGTIRLRLRGRPVRTAFVIFSPVIATVFIATVLFFPLAYAHRNGLIGPTGYHAMMLSAHAAVAWLIGRTAPHGLPRAALTYYAIGFVALPLLVFALGTGRSPWILLRADAEWFGISPLPAILMTTALAFAAGWAGHASRRAKHPA